MAQMSRVIFPDEEPEYFSIPEEPKKPALAPHHIVQLIAALLNTLVLVIGWQKANSPVFKIFVWLVGALLVAMIGRYALRGLRWVSKKIRNRKFIAIETVSLVDMFGRFKKFANKDDVRSIRNIISNASGNRTDITEKFFGSDYISSWIESFQRQMQSEPTSVKAFLIRCQEFSNIVKEFTANYVLRAHKEVMKSDTQLPEHYLEQLDTFREEYNSFARVFEDWAQSMVVKANTVLGEGPEYMSVLPCTAIERIKSFKRVAATGT